MEKTFLPIVKPDKMADFLKTWRDWLVLSNEIEEEKFPGKLKESGINTLIYFIFCVRFILILHNSPNSVVQTDK